MFGIVAIGSSLGGVQALSALVAGLPAHFPLPILICHHVMRDRPTMLPSIIARRTPMRVALADEGVRPAPGTIHIAPPDRHLLVLPDGSLGLSDADRVNFCRPSLDVLFRSVAAVHGSRAIGVVLTGHGRDGAFGSRFIQQCGGLVIAEDAATAEVGDMPLAAREIGGADLVLPLGCVAAALDALARQETGGLERHPTNVSFVSKGRNDSLARGAVL